MFKFIRDYYRHQRLLRIINDLHWYQSVCPELYREYITGLYKIIEWRQEIEYKEKQKSDERKRIFEKSIDKGQATHKMIVDEVDRISKARQDGVDNFAKHYSQKELDDDVDSDDEDEDEDEDDINSLVEDDVSIEEKPKAKFLSRLKDYSNNTK